MSEELIVVGISREVISRQKLARLYEEGGKRAMAFMMRVVNGKRERNGEKWDFNAELVREIHRKILFFAPEESRGKLRDIDDYSTESDTDPVLPGRLVPTRFALFGRWLNERAHDLLDNVEDLELALKIAAEAHEGIVGTQLHPFYDGNKRTARVLINGILMSGTKELREHGHAIPPVPLIRWPLTDKGRLDPYIGALRQVRRSYSLNPMERYIAGKWAANLDMRLCEIKKTLRRPTSADIALIDKFISRHDALLSFIEREDFGQNERHPIPDYLPRERAFIL